MKIFVTGGAGFIGRNLVEYFLKKKYEVTIFDNFSNSSKNDLNSFIKKNAKMIHGNILDVEKLANELQGHQAVIHLAAKISVKESIEKPEETFQVNVDGTKNLLECCEKLEIRKIIALSSAAVYGNLNDPIKVLDEHSPTKPLSPYGQSKLDMEKIIMKKTASKKINAIILRLFNIYGKGQSKAYAGVITEFIENIKNNKELCIYGTGKQTRDFINIKDAITAIELSLLKINQNYNSTYNIGSGQSISILELAEMLISLSKANIGIKFTNAKPGDIMYSATSINKARKELGFNPTISLENGLLELLN